MSHDALHIILCEANVLRVPEEQAQLHMALSNTNKADAAALLKSMLHDGMRNQAAL